MLKTPLAHFFNAIIKLHIEKTDAGFYYKNIAVVLESSFCSQLALSNSKELLRKITTENLVYLPLKSFTKYDKANILFHILEPCNKVNDLQNKLRWLVNTLKSFFIEAQDKSLELEQLLGVHTTLNQMEQVLLKETSICELKNLSIHL